MEVHMHAAPGKLLQLARQAKQTSTWHPPRTIRLRIHVVHAYPPIRRRSTHALAARDHVA